VLQCVDYVIICDKFRREWTDHLEQSATCTTRTGAVTERFHTCTQDTPVLVRPAQTARNRWDFLRNSGAEYKYTHLLTYFTD